MARYLPEIDGPNFFNVYIDINGVETEVEVYVAKAATGEYYVDYENPNGSGWDMTTDPEFLFEAFDDEGKPIIFTMDQMAILDDVANEHFWQKVGE